MGGECQIHATSGRKPGDQSRLVVRLLWFAGLWLGGVVTVAVVAYLLRLWIVPG
jgi:hypothetical protein